jgi:N-acetylneuraminic acid mutarotase
VSRTTLHRLLVLLIAGWLPAISSAESWSVTGSLNEARRFHTATLLEDGRVLVVGGYGRGDLRSELYDPATGTWSPASAPSVPRAGHTATLLADGRVLVVGGAETALAEIYEPATGEWTGTGSMSAPRSGHTATLLMDGNVLLVGGYDHDSLPTAELYDAVSGTWSTTGPLNVLRYWHTANLLPSGSVLVIGGSNDGDLASTLASAEIYDPTTRSWAEVAGPRLPSVFHAATTMPDGRVFVTGGYDWPPRSWTRSELFDPETHQWSATGALAHGRDGHSATSLPNGDLLVAGGFAWTWLSRSGLDTVRQSELYSAAAGQWRTVGSLNETRRWHTATLLLDGRVLVAGGTTLVGETGFNEVALASAELFGVAGEIEVCKNHYILTRPCPAPQVQAP